MARSSPPPDGTDGSALRWSIEHRGMQYPGQLVVADAWHPQLGDIQEKDTHFRLVLLTQPQDILPQDIADPRVILYIPCASGTLAAAPQRAMGKAAAPYRLPVAGTKGLPLPPRWKHLLGRLREGHIVAGGGSTLQLWPTQIEGTHLAHLLAQALDGAHHQVLVDTSSFPRPFSSPDAEQLFRALLAREIPLSVELEGFALGLGLTTPLHPQAFDPARCPVFPILEEKLIREGGVLPLGPLYRELACHYGLTCPAISLFLLAFVAYGHPSTELRGGRAGEKRLNQHQVSRYSWMDCLEDSFQWVCYSSPLLWRTMQPFIAVVLPDLTSFSSEEEIAHEEERFHHALSELRETSLQVGEVVGHLPWGEMDRAVLKRISELAASPSSLRFYIEAKEMYPSPQGLAEDVARVRRWHKIAPFVREAGKARAYLEEAVVDEKDEELYLDKASLLGQLTLANLEANPHLWPSLDSLFQWFRARYSEAYQRHHRHYHQEQAVLNRALAAAQGLVAALKHLNSVVELGAPLAESALASYESLGVPVCPIPLPDLQRSALCGHCHLTLTDSVPRERVTNLLEEIEAALRQQQRRLSRQIAHHILAYRGQGDRERFLQVAQATDISGLVEIMDEELAAFLRKLFKEASSFPPSAPTEEESHG
ncbi:MAG: hypothetical protein HYU86_00040 [Chloroflexi bacterium]|nr:hypothetical protein [Chloroflexota bacterium]